MDSKKSVIKGVCAESTDLFEYAKMFTFISILMVWIEKSLINKLSITVSQMMSLFTSIFYQFLI